MWKDNLAREYLTAGFVCFIYVTHKTTYFFFSFGDTLHVSHVRIGVRPSGKSFTSSVAKKCMQPRASLPSAVVQYTITTMS